MPTDLPIACSLDAAELTSRLEEMRALGRDGLLSVNGDELRAELRFADRADIRERVEQIVAAESRCCAFLTMTVSDAANSVVLTIDAPDGAEPVLRELVGAFRKD